MKLLIFFTLCIVLSCDDSPTEAKSRFLNYTTKTNLKLPFNEEWFVFWGGRTLSQNNHADIQEQRFAMDILQMKDNSTFSGDGKQNEDYYCFNKPLLSPGHGVIVYVKSNIPDNIPGELNTSEINGNHVVIDHLNGEYSILAHFKQNTIVVNVNDTVQQGQLLGNTGNSGNSSEPHIHYHMQNTSDLFSGEGLPTQFQNYYANGIFVERGEPVKNEFIKNK